MPPENLETRTSTGDGGLQQPPLTLQSVPPSGISDAALRAAKPAAKAYKLAIGGGLYLEVMPGGSKLWRWKYRIGGKENRYAMGSYPELSLKEAREESEAVRKLVKQGVHPAQQKRLDRMQSGQEHANTFEAIAKEWLALKDWEDRGGSVC